VLTLLVMSLFSSFLGASRACADFRESTEESRLKGWFLASRIYFVIGLGR
jgi:hypothetical protein